MTPKEKAIDLVDKFYQTTPNESWFNPPLGILEGEYKSWKHAKEMSLIAVDEIIKSRKDDIVFDDTKLGIVTYHITPHPMYLTYWLKVKEEINKL